MNKMLKNKAISLFLVLLITISFTSLVFALADSYGNQINSFTFQQKEAGAWVTRGSANSTNFVSEMNITIEENGNFLVYVDGLLNKTLVSDYSNATNYSHYAIAIQIFDNVSFAEPFLWTLPAYYSGDFWHLDAVKQIDNNIIANTTVCNITQWVDYQNGSSWVLAEEWVFNLQTTITDSTLPVISTSLNMDIFYFWAFIITLMGTTIFGVGLFKAGSGKFLIYFLFCLMFCITFYSMLASSMI